MPRPARVSSEQILAAAALEFAACGYAGARVDRIARRARVNKAMLYYHFRSKAHLYRTLLRQMFTLAAGRMHDIAALDVPPPEKIDRVIAALAVLIEEHPFFPAIMLREVAEGGAHLDRATLTALAAVPREVGAMVADGITRGAFRRVNPVFAYFSLFAPVVFYLAGAPIRNELSDLRVIDMRALSPAEFVAHAQEAARRALAATP